MVKWLILACKYTCYCGHVQTTMRAPYYRQRNEHTHIAKQNTRSITKLPLIHHLMAIALFPGLSPQAFTSLASREMDYQRHLTNVLFTSTMSPHKGTDLYESIHSCEWEDRSYGQSSGSNHFKDCISKQHIHIELMSQLLLHGVVAELTITAKLQSILVNF